MAYHGHICHLFGPFIYVMSYVFPREESSVFTTCFVHVSGLIGNEDIKE
jgi:hypothetical protein